MRFRHAIFCLVLAAFSGAVQAEQNVLFIIVDDLRPDLPVYGNDRVRAPHIASLASEGVVFDNAYANVPVCGASRASFMSGLRPTTRRFLNYYSRLDEDAPDIVPLHSFLKANGFQTESLGKVMHIKRDSVEGWSRAPWSPGDAVPKDIDTGFRNYQDPENIAAFRNDGHGPSTEALDVPDEAYFDGQTADEAIAALARLKDADEPFFLAVGFVKPHLPFTAPGKYWDLYEHDEIELAANKIMPEGIPSQARHSFGELRNYSDVPEEPGDVDDELARRLRHGYYASISYTDAQVGRLLEQLDALGLAESTIVVLIGDHGWSLGEHGLWAKHSPFDVATRTVAIVRSPGAGATGVAQGLIEFVDLYPTLVELLGLEPPAHLQGESFVPLLRDPGAPGKEAVFPRWKNADVIKTPNDALTVWRNKQGKVQAQMLFDHDLDRAENNNVADDPEYRLRLSELRLLLDGLR